MGSKICKVIVDTYNSHTADDRGGSSLQEVEKNKTMDPSLEFNCLKNRYYQLTKRKVGCVNALYSYQTIATAHPLKEPSLVVQ